MLEDIIILLFSILTFLIVYGLLNRLKFFGKTVNLTISITISMFLLLSLYYYQQIVLTFSLSILFLFLLFILATILKFRKNI